MRFVLVGEFKGGLALFVHEVFLGADADDGCIEVDPLAIFKIHS